MEPGEINIEEVLKKWEKHHPPPEKKSNDEKPWYQKPLSDYSGVNQKRRERRRTLKKATPDYVNEGHYVQKRFRVIPPILENNIQNYQISQCDKCRTLLQYFPSVAKDTKNSQTLSLFEYAASKVNFKWLGIKYVQSKVLNACYQSKDELLLKQVQQKQCPVLFVHNVSGFFSSVLLHLFCASFGKFPYTLIKDEYVSSPTLKYLMKKIGFIFMNDLGDNNEIAEMITSLLKSNNHVLVDMQETELSSSLTDRLFPAVLDSLRSDDPLLKQLLLLPVTISVETKSDLFSSYTLSKLLKDLLFPTVSHRGLAHFNISRSVKLQSVMALASELNEQESTEEENNLIMRHISFDLLELGSILPIHLVSFLLLTKYRESVSVEVLNSSIEWLIGQLQSNGKFIGFTGNTSDVTDHALKILSSDGVIEIDTLKKIVMPDIKSHFSVTKLYNNSKRIIFVFTTKAILAKSIVACLGGRQDLLQGSCYNVKCSGEKLLERAEYLAELLSFVFDFCCPFNKIAEDLVDSLEKMVTMDILNTSSDTFESQTHQKLVHSIAVDSVFDEEEGEYGQCNGESEVTYNVNLQDNNVVEIIDFLSSCISPFIEVVFTVVALIRESGPSAIFTVDKIYDNIVKRSQNGFFMYGEMVSINFISRIFDFLYEKEIIDEHQQGFQVSPFYLENGELEKLLAEIAMFR